jgi:hypothetical protein
LGAVAGGPPLIDSDDGFGVRTGRFTDPPEIGVGAVAAAAGMPLIPAVAAGGGGKLDKVKELLNEPGTPRGVASPGSLATSASPRKLGLGDEPDIRFIWPIEAWWAIGRGGTNWGVRCT